MTDDHTNDPRRSFPASSATISSFRFRCWISDDDKQKDDDDDKQKDDDDHGTIQL